MVQAVEDRSAEVGIKLNNILTALVLMVMSWVGINIQVMKTTQAETMRIDAVQTEKLINLRERLDAHIISPLHHSYFGKEPPHGN